jgi:hypothetical protein
VLELGREPLIGPREHPLDHARDRTLEGVAAQRELAPKVSSASRLACAQNSTISMRAEVGARPAGLVASC